MDEVFDVIIVGGGPAGLFAGLTSTKKAKKVLIIEKSDELGKKFLMSGSGRCNITNNIPINLFPQKFGKNGNFVKPVLGSFTNSDLINWFLSHGIKTKTLNDNKVFPENENAKELLNVLVDECKRLDVKIICKQKIQNITHSDKQFKIETQSDIFTSNNLIISTGGSSYPSTGSTGDGYNFAKSLGHSIVKPEPALTPVLIEDYKFKTCSGISFENINLSIVRNNKVIYKAIGDLLFTHKGLSGPVILDSSRYMEKNDIIKVNLTDFPDSHAFTQDINSKLDLNGKKEIKNLICSYQIPEKLVLNLLEMLNITSNKKVAEIDKKEKKIISDNLTGLEFKILEKSGFNEAMVTTGGVNTTEINRKTMESNIVKGLFFAGEVIDVDGDTGGFNLQFAFSSGYAAGNNIVI